MGTTIGGEPDRSTALAGASSLTTSTRDGASATPTETGSVVNDEEEEEEEDDDSEDSLEEE